jgi:hypothetical protein
MLTRVAQGPPSARRILATVDLTYRPGNTKDAPWCFRIGQMALKILYRASDNEER